MSSDEFEAATELLHEMARLQDILDNASDPKGEAGAKVRADLAELERGLEATKLEAREAMVARDMVRAKDLMGRMGELNERIQAAKNTLGGDSGRSTISQGTAAVTRATTASSNTARRMEISRAGSAAGVAPAPGVPGPASSM